MIVAAAAAVTALLSMPIFARAADSVAVAADPDDSAMAVDVTENTDNVLELPQVYDSSPGAVAVGGDPPVDPAATDGNVSAADAQQTAEEPEAAETPAGQTEADARQAGYGSVDDYENQREPGQFVGPFGGPPIGVAVPLARFFPPPPVFAPPPPVIVRGPRFFFPSIPHGFAGPIGFGGGHFGGHR